MVASPRIAEIQLAGQNMDSLAERGYFRIGGYTSGISETTIGRVIIPFVNWPQWLQIAVILPHALLGFIATLLWWPKSQENWRRFAIVAAYFLVFFLGMRFVFNAR
jgi:hypothetical protein